MSRRRHRLTQHHLPRADPAAVLDRAVEAIFQLRSYRLFAVFLNNAAPCPPAQLESPLGTLQQLGNRLGEISRVVWRHPQSHFFALRVGCQQVG